MTNPIDIEYLDKYLDNYLTVINHTAKDCSRVEITNKNESLIVPEQKVIVMNMTLN